MKVEQEQPEGFTLITITIETQEEADLMWAALNSCFMERIENSDGHIPDNDLYSDLSVDMWSAYDEVYPTGW